MCAIRQYPESVFQKTSASGIELQWLGGVGSSDGAIRTDTRQYPMTVLKARMVCIRALFGCDNDCLCNDEIIIAGRRVLFVSMPGADTTCPWSSVRELIEKDGYKSNMDVGAQVRLNVNCRAYVYAHL